MIYVKSNIVGSPPTQKNEGYKEASAIIKGVKGYDSQHSRLCDLTENSTNLFMPAGGKPRQRFERFWKHRFRHVTQPPGCLAGGILTFV